MNVSDTPAKEIGQGHLDWDLTTKRNQNVIFTIQCTIISQNVSVFDTPAKEVGQGHLITKTDAPRLTRRCKDRNGTRRRRQI